jgi:hypothetical protein
MKEEKEQTKKLVMMYVVNCVYVIKWLWLCL